MVKVVEKIGETKNKINSIGFDAHWYRRVFHAFGASFLFYYLLPELDWIFVLKFWVPPILVILALTLEILRIKGKISSDHFFGLRMYEQKRIGSYAFFAIGILLLLRFFPQQIAVPCILCACLADPIMGEIRKRFKGYYAHITGFFLCMSFFMISWHKADTFLMIFVGIIGGIGAVAGETKKYRWLDDDFMIQMVPAILVLIIWFLIPEMSLEYPGEIINPVVWRF